MADTDIYAHTKQKEIDLVRLDENKQLENEIPKRPNAFHRSLAEINFVTLSGHI